MLQLGKYKSEKLESDYGVYLSDVTIAALQDIGYTVVILRRQRAT